MPDHVHTVISVPPKYLVAEARGDVSTVGRNEEMIRAYIKTRKSQTCSWISCN
jgi:REP element-mobilizing transposase RayT